MCTITYIPQKGGYILTHNRDESTAREKAHPPRTDRSHNPPLLYPLDPVGKGSWMVASAGGVSACIMNGAFGSHMRRPPYRHSRGLVALHFFDYSSAKDFAANYNFSGLEDFTLLVVSEKGTEQVMWDGREAHYEAGGNDKCRIFHAPMLYSVPRRRERECQFRHFLTTEKVTANAIMELHGGAYPYADFVLNRPPVRTLSTTQVLCGKDKMRMRYRELVNGGQTEVVEIGKQL